MTTPSSIAAAVVRHADLTDELLGVAHAMTPETLEVLVRVAHGVAAMPGPFGSLMTVLEHGAAKHPGGGLGADGQQSVDDHLRKAVSHLHATWPGFFDGRMPVDNETKQPSAAHVAGRCLLAMDRAGRGG